MPTADAVTHGVGTAPAPRPFGPAQAGPTRHVGATPGPGPTSRSPEACGPALGPGWTAVAPPQSGPAPAGPGGRGPL